MEESKPIPKVEEILLRKRKKKSIIHANNLKDKIKQRGKKKRTHGPKFKRAESFVKTTRKVKKDRIRLKREARFLGGSGTKEPPQLAFVVRISDDKAMNGQTKRVLSLLRLKSKLQGTFVHLNEVTRSLLKIAGPYVTWGYPNLQTIRELIMKRGYGRVRGEPKKEPLTDNTFIEKHLGSHDVICIEDIIHELHTVGPNFKAVNNFIWNLKLNMPESGFKNRAQHFLHGGDHGDRGEQINQLLMKMV